MALAAAAVARDVTRSRPLAGGQCSDRARFDREIRLPTSRGHRRSHLARRRRRPMHMLADLRKRLFLEQRVRTMPSRGAAGVRRIPRGTTPIHRGEGLEVREGGEIDALVAPGPVSRGRRRTCRTRAPQAGGVAAPGAAEGRASTMRRCPSPISPRNRSNTRRPVVAAGAVEAFPHPTSAPLGPSAFLTASQVA